MPRLSATVQPGSPGRRRRYWQLAYQLNAHDGNAITHLSQIVDTAGNVFAYDGNPEALFGCGQWVGQIEPAMPGFFGWGLEAAGPPFSPPPFSPPPGSR